MNLFELSAKISADTMDYEKAVKNATKVSKSLKDIMERAATQSETNKNKIKVLASEYSSTKAKVATLTTAFNKAAKEEGVTSERTKQLAKELQEAEKESSDLKGQLDELTKKSKSAGDGFSNLGSALGKGLKIAGKIGVSAVGAAAAGVAALTAAAVNNYAEYEQLVGGIETLYEDLSWDVGQNAAKAFQTAGLSANEYMSTAMSFAASLNQSLTEMDGNIARSADLTDQAILDMADNANKMGSDLSTLQTAYAGFAKQNYTLLDNLKIGYGGTKEEMQRLIADAAELSDTVDAQSMSFANIVEAIHVVQTEMGITGTTALEAGRTISGSVGAMKSAWTNLVTGLADGNADIGQLVDNLVTTIVGDGTESNLGVLGNVMPAVKTALSGASKLVSELLPKIVQEIPSIINDNLPIFAEAAISIIQSLVDGISENQEMLMKTAFDTIVFLTNSLISMLPQIVALGLDLIVSLANGISENVEELVPTIVDVVLQIVDTLTNPDTLSSLVDACIAIIIGLANGLIAALPNLLEKAPVIIQNLVTAIVENVPKLLDAAWEVIKTLVQGLIDNFPEILAAGEEILNSLIDGVEALFTDLYDLGKDIIDEIKEGISKAWQGLTTWFNNLWDSLFGNREVDVVVNKNENTGPAEPEANGISYVPYDGYYALLHEGERVLTAEENKVYSGGSRNTSGITIVQNIQAVPQTPAEFAASTAAYFEQARWAI